MPPQNGLYHACGCGPVAGVVGLPPTPIGRCRAFVYVVTHVHNVALIRDCPPPPPSQGSSRAHYPALPTNYLCV